MSMDIPVETHDAGQLKEMGLQAFRSGDLQAAEEAFDRALETYAAADDTAGQAEMQVNLGVIHVQNKRYDQAEKELTLALDAFRSLSRRSEEAQVLGNLGMLYARMGDKEQAADYYRRAAEIFEELGEKENLQATLGALTQLQVSDKKWMQSLFTYEQMIANGEKLTFKQRVFTWLFRIVSKLMNWR